MENDIGEIIRKLETDFTSGTGTLMSKYVRNDLYEDINTIYAYLNSKHISGETDSMGREKPFFNVVIAARNIWYRATDLDRKNIILKAVKEEDTIAVFLLNVLLQDWMKRERFGTFLNSWGLELAGFNSVVVKFVEKDGKLIPSVVPWSRLIVDQINFQDNVKIEILELTESQLYDRYDKKLVEELCNAKKARELTNKQVQDNKNNYYKLYEVHGVLSLSNITDKESDEDIFVQQMHVVSMVAREQDKGEDVFTLYKGREEKDPYMLTSLIPATDGSVSLDGAVKNLFQAQWMVNHSKKAIKDQLDLASKLIFQTSDGNFIGQNALSAIESGDILIHSLNQPLTQLNNNSHDVTSLSNFGAEWKMLGQEINGISEAMLGVTPKSGTAWRQTEAVLQESHSLFEIMTENKGLCIEDMLRIYIIPFLKKKMNNSKQVTAMLDMYGIKEIEARYIKNTAIKESNKMVIDQILSGQIAQQPDIEALQTGIAENLNEQGNQRFFKPDDGITWKEVVKDLEYDVEVEVTGEQADTQAVMTTINTALQTMINPAYSQNPQAQFLVNKILSKTGYLSPVEISQMPQQTMNPITPQVGGGGEEEISKLTEQISK
jgi:hypothetical protein